MQLTTELPVLDSSIEIDGPGAEQLTVRANPTREDRVFFVTQNGTITIAAEDVPFIVHSCGSDSGMEVYAGRGDDVAYGGSGEDWLRGQRGDDVLYGGPQRDVLLGGLGKDRLFGTGDDVER